MKIRVSRQGREIGQFELAQLKSLFEIGSIAKTDTVFLAKDQAWVAIEKIPSLMKELAPSIDFRSVEEIFGEPNSCVPTERALATLADATLDAHLDSAACIDAVPTNESEISPPPSSDVNSPPAIPPQEESPSQPSIHPLLLQKAEEEKEEERLKEAKIAKRNKIIWIFIAAFVFLWATGFLQGFAKGFMKSFTQAMGGQKNEQIKSPSSKVGNADSFTFVDRRDGQKYRAVKIGNQTWMAQNLNYQTEADSWCYNNNPKACAVAGRLYTWAAAMALNMRANDVLVGNVNHRGICPMDWHVPDKDEWYELMEFNSDTSAFGTRLMSTKGWIANGSDDYGFSALPAGYRDNDDTYSSIDDHAMFWSSKEHDAERAWYFMLKNRVPTAARYFDHKGYAFSLRCVKDN